MPNCFRLYYKEHPEIGHVPGPQVDMDICVHFDEIVDSKKWFLGWMDVLGWQIAVVGQTLNDLPAFCIDRFSEQVDYYGMEFWAYMVQIAYFLRDNYTSDAWVEIGRR